MKNGEDKNQTDEELKNDNRIAMRAYLQRAETRLAIIHRIAGVFLTGAGLIILLPVYITGTFKHIFNAIITIDNIYIVFIMSFILIITLAIPMYSVYQLFRDIVQFYFTPHNPGFKGDYFQPRFTLSGITLPIDEVNDGKKCILRKQLTKDMIHFVLPYKQEKLNYFTQMLDHSGDNIMPPTRLPPKNEPTQSVSLIDENMLKQITNGDIKHRNLIDLVHVSFGLAGSVDRMLHEEVAKMELSLVRHIIHLRRIMLRYMKAFLILIWTILILNFVTASLNEDFLIGLTKLLLINNVSIDYYLPELSAVILAIGFLIWAICMPIIVTAPIRWIYALTDANQAMKKFRKDEELIQFEQIVVKYAIAIVFLASVCTIYEIDALRNIEPNILKVLLLSIGIGILYYKMVNHLVIQKNS